MPGRDAEADLVERGAGGAGIAVGDLVEGDRAAEPRTHAGGRIGCLRALVQHRRGQHRGGADLADVFHQLGQAGERLGDAGAEHHEGDQAADRNSSGVGQRDVGAEQQDAALHEALDRVDQHLRQVGQPADGELGLGGFGHLLVPVVALLRLQRERLDRADAVQGFDHDAGLGGSPRR